MPQNFHHTIMYILWPTPVCFQDAPGFAGDHVPQVVVDPPTSSNPNFNHIPPGKSPNNLRKTKNNAHCRCYLYFCGYQVRSKKKMGAGVTFMKIINHQFDFKTTGNSWVDTKKNCSSKQVSENDWYTNVHSIFQWCVIKVYAIEVGNWIKFAVTIFLLPWALV